MSKVKSFVVHDELTITENPEKEPLDYYKQVAAILYQIPYENVTPEQRSVAKAKALTEMYLPMHWPKPKQSFIERRWHVIKNNCFTKL